MKRWAPLTGVAFVALLVAAFAVGGSTPDGSDSAQKISSFYNDHDSKELFSAILLVYGTVFFLFFLAVLRADLRRTDATGVLSGAAFAGGVLFAVGGLLFAGLTFTLADLADKLDPTAMQAINGLNADMFPVLAAGSAVFLIATGIATVRGGFLPTWLGWVGIVIGIVAITPLGFFGFLASMLWVLVVSIVMATRDAPGAAGAAAPPPASAPG